MKKRLTYKEYTALDDSSLITRFTRFTTLDNDSVFFTVLGLNILVLIACFVVVIGGRL